MAVFLVSVLLLGLSGGAIDATPNACAARTFTTAERTSAAVADRMIGFQAAASALSAAVIHC
jgi:Tfp pilus assembly protein PilX